jgi:hypothetical protein
MEGPVTTIFARHVQYCLAGCCHYVHSRPVSEDQYEALLSRLPSPPRRIPGNPVEFQEVMVPCQNIELHKAVGQQIGFYLGEPRDRSAGPLNLYDAKSREYLRLATEEDVKKWNDAIEAGIRKSGKFKKNWRREDQESAANDR